TSSLRCSCVVFPALRQVPAPAGIRIRVPRGKTSRLFDRLQVPAFAAGAQHLEPTELSVGGGGGEDEPEGGGEDDDDRDPREHGHSQSGLPARKIHLLQPPVAARRAGSGKTCPCM